MKLRKLSMIQKENIILIDSINLENRFKKQFYKRNVTQQHSIYLFYLFIKGESQRD